MLLIAVMLLRLGSSVSMVAILLGTLRMGHLVMSYVTVRMVAIFQVA
jgi:predicted membrane protein